jgi:hypothetical protein
MPPVTLQVKLLEMSKDPLTLLYVAYRQCYSAQWAGDMWEEDEGEKRRASFIRKMMRSGHDSHRGIAGIDPPTGQIPGSLILPAEPAVRGYEKLRLRRPPLHRRR